MNQIVCSWCQTVNHANDLACIACGAPIEKLARAEVAMNADATPLPPPLSREVTTQDLRQAGEKADKLYNSALNAYGLAWRTLGEAVAIAGAAFLLGLAGGATHLAWLGVLGGLVVGLLVGLVQKNFWLTILGAPVGVLAGAVTGLLAWVLGAGPAGMLISAVLLGGLGALAGRRNSRSGVWNKLRPWLGGLGGLFFGGLGALAGAGLAWLVDFIIRNIRM